MDAACTKSLDLAGVIVDATKVATVDDHLWVASQLAKRDKYLEIIRQRVLAGSYKLTAALARLLGMPWDDGALLTDRSGGENGERVMRDLRMQLELPRSGPRREGRIRHAT